MDEDGFVRTTELRFVKRTVNFREWRILQQLWVLTYDDTEVSREWRDVPVEEEDVRSDQS